MATSELEFYGDLVYKFRKIIGKYDFLYHSTEEIVRYKKSLVITLCFATNCMAGS